MTEESAIKRLARDPRFVFGFGFIIMLAAIAIFSESLAPYERDMVILEKIMAGPSQEYWLGNDIYGGDILSQIIRGSRTTITIAFATVLITVVVGTIAGIISGYYGKWIDKVIMRIVDSLMAFPGILTAMALASLLGPSEKNVIIAISLTGWTSTARVMRSSVMSLKTRDFIQSSIALGSSSFSIMIRHILPNLLTQIMIVATFSLSGVIIIEASLSFLGLSGGESYGSWGALLDQGKSVLSDAPHVSIFPGIAIFLSVLALNYLGDSLRDHFDPKFKN